MYRVRDGNLTPLEFDSRREARRYFEADEPALCPYCKCSLKQGVPWRDGLGRVPENEAEDPYVDDYDLICPTCAEED